MKSADYYIERSPLHAAESQLHISLFTWNQFYGSLRYSQKFSLVSTLHQLNTFDILHFIFLRSCSLCTILYYLNWSLLRFSYQNLGNFSFALVSCAFFPYLLNIIILIIFGEENKLQYKQTIYSLCLFGRQSLWQLKGKRPTWSCLLFYFTSYVLNMSRTLIYPSSGACDYSVELPHWSYCSWFDVCWSFGVVGLVWYPCCRLKPNYTETPTHIEPRTIRPMW